MRWLPSLLLLACGAGPAGTDEASESAYETTAASVETEGCACTDVLVRCDGGGAMYARTDRAACTFDLPASMCALLGLEAGARVEPGAIAAAAAPARLDAPALFDLCAARHEAVHACDGPEPSSCATEARAYDATVACMTELRPRLCAPGEEDTDGCRLVDRYVDASRAAGELNACLCAGRSCAECASACVSAHPDVEGTCADAAAAYCAGP